ncbi:hypothetical protein NQ318_002665 [Aromia moschata]|uniref:Major facilitator superfamily (MFS) profile domain-containing protein n=1 Tax=Aromia moschata TaxID=1265417 RepID=A0AAV8XTM6_9CUCU|nr:hypothetical protein NQ318_002665 [Aromia moschata]
MYPKLHSNDSSINPIGRPITDNEDSLLGSLVTIGAMFGPFPFSFIAGKFGRKIGLLCVAIPHIISYITMAFAKNIYLFFFGRVFGGLALGGGYSLLPMYIAEISRDSNRGTMSLTLTVFWAIGNFIPYAIGPYLSVMWFNIILAFIPIAFFIIFTSIGTETPYYLVEAHKTDQAETSLMKLRNAEKDGIQKELESIKAHLKSDEDGHLSDILKRSELRKALIICVILVVSQELSGFCSITFYMQPIFEAAGTNLSADTSALIVGVGMLVSSFISPFLADRLGRRILLVVSCSGMCIALFLLGTFFYILDSTDFSTDPINWLPIFSLLLFIFSFNFGLCTVPWTLCSELFPNNVKGIAASIQTSTCWLSSFIITFSFNHMNAGMGRAGSFWFFSASSLASTIFCVIFVPETKGKSFSEIQDMLRYGSRKMSLISNGNPEMKASNVWSTENSVK